MEPTEREKRCETYVKQFVNDDRYLQVKGWKDTIDVNDPYAFHQLAQGAGNRSLHWVGGHPIFTMNVPGDKRHERWTVSLSDDCVRIFSESYGSEYEKE